MAEYTYTVTLSEAEDKALHVVAVSAQEWISNVVHERCRWAMDEIYAAEVKRMTDDPNITSIPASRDAVILAAQIDSAAEQNRKILAGEVRTLADPE
jgi:hypothetical protein